MQKLERTLQDVGFSRNEARVYLAALELGETSVQRIAQKAGFKRTTAQAIVENLRDRGFIISAKRGGRNVYFAAEPETLLEKERRRVELIERTLPGLKAFANALDKKPHIRYYDTTDALKRLYMDMLAFGGKEIVMWFSKTGFMQFDPEFWDAYYVPERKKKEIWFRAIAKDTDAHRAFQKKDKDSFRKTLLDDSPEATFNSEIVLYGNRHIAVTSFTDTTGIVIESKQIFDTFKYIFERHWHTLER